MLNLFWVAVVWPIALDRQPRLQAFNNEINPVAARTERLILWNDPVILRMNKFSNFPLEIAFAFVPVGIAHCVRRRIAVIAEKLVAHTAWIQFVDRSCVKQPHLVPRTTGRDIEALLVRLFRERTYALVWCGNHTEELHVALVSLKCVSIATDQVTIFDFLRFQAF